MKFATKPTQHYPPHLRHVATLSGDIKNSNVLQIFSRYGKNAKKCIFSAPIFTVRLHVMQRTVLLSQFCLSVCPSDACIVTK